MASRRRSCLATLGSRLNLNPRQKLTTTIWRSKKSDPILLCATGSRTVGEMLSVVFFLIWGASSEYITSLSQCPAKRPDLALCLAGHARTFPEGKIVDGIVKHFVEPFGANVTTFLYLKLHDHSTKGKTRAENLDMATDTRTSHRKKVYVRRYRYREAGGDSKTGVAVAECGATGGCRGRFNFSPAELSGKPAFRRRQFDGGVVEDRRDLADARGSAV